ncbi:MAG: outer membrane beta-barrel protein [Bacteroidales bacterium]
MKKSFLFLFSFLLLLTFNLRSQNESFLGLCLGAALPQGEYATNNFEDSLSGYANTGFLFTFDGTVFPDDYLGISATVSYGSNNIDKIQYREDFINDVLTRYPDFEVEADCTSFDMGVWRYLNFHIGPAITVGAGSFNFDVRAMAGMSLAWAPDQSIQLQWENGDNFSRKVENKAVPTWGFTVGGGVRYTFKNSYVLRFITEYTNCKPSIEFREDLIRDIEEGASEVSTYEVKMPIKNIHIGIGIAYNFEL